MIKFILKKEKKKKKIIEIKLPIQGYSIKPRLKKHQSLIEIKEITLVQKKLKKQMIEKQFDRTFRKLVAIMLDVTESEDSTSSDCAIALNEVSKVASMIEKKYQKELQKKEYEKLLKKLWMIDAKLKEKMLEIRTNEMLAQMTKVPETKEERGRGR